MTFSDTDFFLQQRAADKGLRQPLMLALALHLIIFTASAKLPDLFNSRPILDEVVTVNLVSLPDIAPPQQVRPEPPPQAEPQPVPKVEPLKAKVPVVQEPVVEQVVQQVVQQEAPAPVKPVSLQPIKRKVKKTDPAKIAAEKARREQELQRQQDLARAKVEEERARQEAEKARAALAEMIRRKGEQSSPAASRPSSGRKEVLSLVEKQYYSSLHARLQQYWVLPEMRQWDSSLETRVVLTIRRDGSVVNTFIEKKARDPFFDQFVKNTIQKALPMPPFPNLMSESSIEVGFIFRPGEIM